MPWQTRTLKEIADNLGISTKEVKEKQRLVNLIVETRKKKGWSQTKLGLSLQSPVSQPRIAKIEAGIENSRTSFDLLFNLLEVLGYTVRVQVKKSA